jgi:hypothetical protein
MEAGRTLLWLWGIWDSSTRKEMKSNGWTDSPKTDGLSLVGVMHHPSLLRTAFSLAAVVVDKTIF